MYKSNEMETMGKWQRLPSFFKYWHETYSSTAYKMLNAMEEKIFPTLSIFDERLKLGNVNIMFPTGSLNINSSDSMELILFMKWKEKHFG